ncbi:sugar transferase [Paenibacillus sp. GCM10012303]|uniref:sugar transferase n=1 Tax=Paenibacillus sp. GCM10012303 TaxID=3317340 RepID=UPI003607889B
MNLPILSNQGANLNQTLETNQKLEQRKILSTAMSIGFIMIEFLSFTSIYFLLYYVRLEFEFNHEVSVFDFTAPRFEIYLLFYSISSVIYLFLVYRYRIFTFRSNFGLSDELLKMTRAYSLAILLTVGISFLLKIDEYSRIVIVSYWIGVILWSAILRWIKRKVYFSFATKGIVSRNVLIVGAGKMGHLIMDELSANKWLGYRIIGFVDDDTNKYENHIQFLGATTAINKIIGQHVIDELIITIPSERDLVNKILRDLRKIDIKINIIPDMFNLVTSTVQFGSINALPVVTLVKTPMRGTGLLLKRIFDLLGASLLIVLISPILLATALAIKTTSKGPIIYTQQRLGKNGKIFKMYKFRSMVVNADQIKEKLVHLNESDGLAFKIKNDPRITPVGRFIRKYSIDELPQFFNILKGDMSLVGPRPPLPNEVERYGDWEWRRLEVLPGITGLWQVSGRSDLSFQQWMNLDVYYIENWSLALDIKIMLKTISVVMKGEGAY